MTKIDREFVEKFVKSWESRHDEWVRNVLAEIIGSNQTTLYGIRSDLKKGLESDWRISLGFFIDRTTYQSRKDELNQKTANYLFKRICSLPKSFSNDSLINLASTIRKEKQAGVATHVREDADIRRLESVSKYLFNSGEKNFSRIVLEIVQRGEDIWGFLKTFTHVGPKTSSFYMKFIFWIFDLDITPVVIDTHVITSLRKYGEIREKNLKKAQKAIYKISNKLNISPVKVETALYEDSWQRKNRPTKMCT